MELKRRFNLRNLFICLYFVAFAIYLAIGLHPADAVNYAITGQVNIPQINLYSDVASLNLENGRLNTPDVLAGSFSTSDNKTLLIGHSTTVFKDLDKLNLSDVINYKGDEYIINDIYIAKKSDISMRKLLKSEERNTLVLMTCHGTELGDGDYTERLIITAVAQ